ncbi:MAG: succinate dehydrogenase/fumarate reductase iron-sulfur subunit [Myxococcota bacterium]
MRVLLHVWRQRDRDADGGLVAYPLDDVHPDMSFLEMLDHLNEQLIRKGERVVEFDHDCREGICGQCGVVIDGRAHGPLPNTTTCQLHMRSFADGSTITVEPFRAAALPIVRDLRVDRSGLDRIMQAGAYISTPVGGAPEANSVPVPHALAEAALDAAACIGCGACIASCKNGSAALFTGAKVSHLAQIPQGKPEARTRVRHMVEQMDDEGFGHCSWTGACAVECPQTISLAHIARMNWEHLKARLLGG